MKYQIQQYQESDQNNRKVVAETDRVATQDELNAWYASEASGVQLETGFALTVVPFNHPWYIPAVKQPTNGPNAAFVQSDSVPKPFEGESVPFEVVAAAERAADAKARVDRMEREKRLAEYLDGFDG